MTLALACLLVITLPTTIHAFYNPHLMSTLIMIAWFSLLALTLYGAMK